jgi:hypothetical protein
MRNNQNKRPGIAYYRLDRCKQKSSICPQ